MSVEPENKAPKRAEKNRLWLVLALVTISLTVVAYAYQDDIIYWSNESAFAYSVLLLLLVLMTLFFLMCYRNPSLGEKIIGGAPDVERSEKDKTAFHYTGFTTTDSASDAKRLNTSRKKTRSNRKHYAAVTREMQDEKKPEDDNQE